MHREQATGNDQEYFWVLNEQCYRNLVVDQFGACDNEAQREYFDVKWSAQGYQKKVVDGIVVGGIWCEELDDHVQLHEIQIHPDFQSRGIGATILMGEIERSKAIGKELRLRVLLRNRAHELYRRLGFEGTHRDVRFYMVHR